MRTDDRGIHYADCMFCGQEWIVSRKVKEPYTCPKCRAVYKKFRSTTKISAPKGGDIFKNHYTTKKRK